MLLRTWSEPNHLFTSRNSITVRGYISLSKIAKCRTAYYMNKGILQQIATRSCIDIARLNGSVLSAATKFFIRCGRFRNKIGGGSVRRGYLSRATRRGRVGKNQSGKTTHSLGTGRGGASSPYGGDQKCSRLGDISFRNSSRKTNRGDNGGASPTRVGRAATLRFVAARRSRHRQSRP